ncbi:VOC family protein [Streptomyces sp. DSS69]|uniref:VOC family protein n=1 Tax=Streptomyces sp. DSS69 TaxID=3113369 RepID=UPI0031F9AB81
MPDLAGAERRWGWLLTRLGHLPYQSWADGRSWRRGESYVVVEQSPDPSADHHDRRRPGLDHLAFHVADRATLDALTAEAPAYGWRLLHPARHACGGGEGHRAARLEDEAGCEVELVVGSMPRP